MINDASRTGSKGRGNGSKKLKLSNNSDPLVSEAELIGDEVISQLISGQSGPSQEISSDPPQSADIEMTQVENANAANKVTLFRHLPPGEGRARLGSSFSAAAASSGSPRAIPDPSQAVSDKVPPVVLQDNGL